MQEGEFAQPLLAPTSNTSRRVANLCKRQQASAITIRAKDFMATKGLGEQAIVMHSQNIEQAVEVELYMGIHQFFEMGGDCLGHLRNWVLDPESGG